MQAHVAAAMINLSDSCPQNIMEPWLQELLSKMLKIILSDNIKIKVKEQAVTAIAGIAHSAQSTFLSYANEIIPALMAMMQDNKTITYPDLRTRIMESLGHIVRGIGTDNNKPLLPLCHQIIPQIIAFLKQNNHSGCHIYKNNKKQKKNVIFWVFYCHTKSCVFFSKRKN